jgi:hypothetical protein
MMVHNAVFLFLIKFRFNYFGLIIPLIQISGFSYFSDNFKDHT